MTIVEQDPATTAEDTEIPLHGPALPIISEHASLQKTVAPLPSTGIAQITKAIAAVMQEIDTVAKRGQHAFHRYRYAKMEDILRQLTPLLGKHGLVVFQDEVGRTMFDDGSVIAVAYEFTVAHESGEIWPHRLRQTGVARCRDSKGGWDDKALNKCHTAARKYFLLSLFQIPTGEEADADHGDNDGADPEASQITPANKGTAKAWTSKFLARIRQAPTLAMLDRWIEENQLHLDRLATAAPDQRKIADDAAARRRTELTPSAKSLPPLVKARTDPA
jgi:ERF superfamily protein